MGVWQVYGEDIMGKGGLGKLKSFDLGGNKAVGHIRW